MIKFFPKVPGSIGKFEVVGDPVCFLGSASGGPKGGTNFKGERIGEGE